MKSLIIYGNIASGKSTVCKLLAKLLPTHKYVCLDHHRVKMYQEHPDLGLGQRDILAQKSCLEELEGPVIYETTAVTRFFKLAKAKLEAEKQELAYVHLDCRPSTCISRYAVRVAGGHIQAPFAWGNYSISESIYYFHERQHQLQADLRINTTKVRAADAARFVAEWI